MDESNVVHVSMDSSLIAKHKNHSADQDTMRESDDSVKRTRSLSGLQQRVYAPGLPSPIDFIDYKAHRLLPLVP